MSAPLNDDSFPEELELQQEPTTTKKDQAAVPDDTKTEGRRRRKERRSRSRSRSRSPSENDEDAGSAGGSGNSGSSDQDESDEEDENNLFDLLTDFFVNDNGDNVATILTNIQASLDQHAKCILKLTKVIQDASQRHK